MLSKRPGKEKIKYLKLKNYRIYTYGGLFCVLLLLGVFIIPIPFNLQGNGQLIYSGETETDTWTERKISFQFPLNNKTQQLVFSIKNHKKIEQITFLFSSYWLLFLELEMVRFLDHYGNIMNEIHFANTKGHSWQLSGVKQLEHYWISESSLKKMAKVGIAPQLLEELSTLKGLLFLKKQQLYAELKQFSYDTNWKEREIIRKYSQKPHYQVVHYKNVMVASPHFSPMTVSQIGFHFRPVVPANLIILFYHKCLVPFWLFFFFGGVFATGTLYSLYTGNPWHMD